MAFEREVFFSPPPWTPRLSTRKRARLEIPAGPIARMAPIPTGVFSATSSLTRSSFPSRLLMVAFMSKVDQSPVTVSSPLPVMTTSVVLPGTESKFLAPLEIRKIYGIGPKTAGLLNKLGVKICSDLVSLDIQKLLPVFGQYSIRLKNKAKGIDDRPVDSSPWIAKQQGTERTFEKDVSDSTIVEDALLELCTEVSQSIGRMGRSARTVTLKLRWSNFDTITRQRTVPGEIHQAVDIYKVAKALLYDNWKPGKPIRLMGVSASRLGVSDQQKLPLEFE